VKNLKASPGWKREAWGVRESCRASLDWNSRGRLSPHENLVEDWDQEQKEGDFVKLGRMTRDTVAEVDGPWQIRRDAVGVVGEAGEEASDPADSDAEGEGDGVEVSGGVAESDVAFGELDADETEG
jgi:hypothetical protein